MEINIAHIYSSTVSLKNRKYLLNSLYPRKCTETTFSIRNTFSGLITCFLITLSEITARLQDILEVGAVGDEAGMKIFKCCCLCVVLPLPGAPPFSSTRCANCILPRRNNLQGGIFLPKMWEKACLGLKSSRTLQRVMGSDGDFYLLVVTFAEASLHSGI